MKNSKWILLLAMLYSATFISGCGEDPAPVNEEELITTLTMTLIRQGGGDTAIFSFRDLDGDGGLVPVITGGTLDDSATYSVTLAVLNESVSPADTITEEIMEEGEEHQFFFQASSGLNLSFTYSDTDDGGKPIGLSATATTAAAGSGQLTVTLRHEPNKAAAGVSAGDITNAGGETDIEVTFDVTVE